VWLSVSCKFWQIWWTLGALNAPAKEVTGPDFQGKEEDNE
jgi:hypothetical protein